MVYVYLHFRRVRVVSMLSRGCFDFILEFSRFVLI